MTRVKKHSYEIAVIVWKDAVADVGWKTVDEVSETHTIVSVGLVVLETDTELVLAGSWGGDPEDELETNNRITIPKGWVIDDQRKKIKA